MFQADVLILSAFHLGCQITIVGPLTALFTVSNCFLSNHGCRCHQCIATGHVGSDELLFDIYKKNVHQVLLDFFFFLQTRRVHWVCFGLERMVTSSGFVRVVPFCCHLATDGLLLAEKPEIVLLQFLQRNNALYKMNVDKKCKIFRLIKDTIIDVMRTKTHTLFKDSAYDSDFQHTLGYLNTICFGVYVQLFDDEL